MEDRICKRCCSREAFFLRSHSGKGLCRECFSLSIENKVRETIAEYSMVKNNDRMAIGVSGGKDSISLLHILNKIELGNPKPSLVAVTVDEGIEHYRDEALRIATENCQKLGIRHYIIHFEELYGYTLDQIVGALKRNEKGELTPCAYCGVLRRKALNIAVRKVKADKLATAHTLDDETQTILMNIFHGNPSRLAKGKPITDQVHPKLPQRLKPFCRIPERETTLYAYINGIEFQALPCPYASEALRNDVRDFLDGMEERLPGTKLTIFDSMEKIRPAISGMIRKVELRKCVECGEPTSQDLCMSCKMIQHLFGA